MSDQGESTPSNRQTKKLGRVASLDVARGLLLISSVTSAAYLSPRPEWLVHAKWIGLTPYDLIFPLFVTLSGVGMAFAYRNSAPWTTSVRRIVVLTVAGVIYGAIATGVWDFPHLRLTGTLQLYGVLVAILALGHVVLRKPYVWMALTLLMGLAFSGFLAYWVAGCPGGALTLECNPSATVDTALFGSHMYAGGSLGHDPEGVFGITGALITAGAGVSAGHLIFAWRQRGVMRVVAALCGWAGVLTLSGFGLTILFPAVPMFKRLWTPPFALVTAALGVAVLAVVYVLVDRVPSHPPRWAKLLIAMGRNSLLVYFGSHLLVDVLARLGEPSIAEKLARAGSLGLPYPLGFVLWNLVFWWGLSLVLHRHKIYIHA